MELKSGMTKPEEFDSSILLLAEFLVIWADYGGNLGGWRAGLGMEPVLNLARVLGRASLAQSSVFHE